jgi:hypothetical protein
VISIYFSVTTNETDFWDVKPFSLAEFTAVGRSKFLRKFSKNISDFILSHSRRQLPSEDKLLIESYIRIAVKDIEIVFCDLRSQ